MYHYSKHCNQMRYFFFSWASLLILFSCEDDLDGQLEMLDTGTMTLEYGISSYKPSGGYFDFNLAISDFQAVLTIVSSYPNDPDIVFERNLTITEYNELLESYDEEIFFRLPEKNPCIDCNSSGVEYIQVVTDSGSHRITFDEIVPSIEDLITKLRNLANEMDQRS